MDPLATPTCLHCNHPSETLDHILLCTVITQWRDQFATELQAWCTQHRTPPHITRALANYLNHFFGTTSETVPFSTPPWLLLRDCVPNTWTHQVDSHYCTEQCHNLYTNGRSCLKHLSHFLLPADIYRMDPSLLFSNIEAHDSNENATTPSIFCGTYPSLSPSATNFLAIPIYHATATMPVTSH